MDEVQAKRKYLKDILNEPGGQILVKHMEELSREGWDKFIDLPVLAKTGKSAYDAQAKYKVLKDLREWWMAEAKMAD